MRRDTNGFGEPCVDIGRHTRMMEALASSFDWETALERCGRLAVGSQAVQDSVACDLAGKGVELSIGELLSGKYDAPDWHDGQVIRSI